MTNEEVIKEIEQMIVDYGNTQIEGYEGLRYSKEVTDNQIIEKVLQALQDKDEEWRGKVDKTREEERKRIIKEMETLTTYSFSPSFDKTDLVAISQVKNIINK